MRVEGSESRVQGVRFTGSCCTVKNVGSRTQGAANSGAWIRARISDQGVECVFTRTGKIQGWGSPGRAARLAGFRVRGSGFRVQGSGFRFRVSGFGVTLACCSPRWRAYSRAACISVWGRVLVRSLEERRCSSLGPTQSRISLGIL